MAEELVRLDLDSIEKGIIPVLKKFPQIAGAYLFGSVLGYCRPDSDIDLGVLLFSDSRSEREEDFLVVDLLEKLPPIKGRVYDIVVLNRQNVIFAYRVISKGKLIFTRSTEVVTDFIEFTSRRYADVYPRYKKALQEIVAEV